MTKKEPEITEPVGENAFLHIRLKELHKEKQEGGVLIVQLEANLLAVKNSAFRVDGAITVLQERKDALVLASKESIANGEAESE